MAPTPKKLSTLAVALALVLFSYPLWKPFAVHQKWFVVATNMGMDSLRRVGWRSGQIGQPAVLSPPESGIAQEVTRTREIYANYLRYAGWDNRKVAGKRMLELGPGAHVGVPLLFAADGASYVAGLDKFVPLQTGTYFRSFYGRLRDTLDNAEKVNFDKAIRLEPKIELRPAQTLYIYGKELSDSVDQLGPGSYDLIASNAVIEEMYDPAPSFQAQDRLLRPGGVMVHKIDLRDYGMFTKYGFPALEFLTVPEWAYRRMAEASGQPNRLRVNYYRGLMERLGYTSRIYITWLLGVDHEIVPAKEKVRPEADYSNASLGMIRDIRPRLAGPFRKLDDSDLMILGIYLVARKRGA
jgi:SAM-dependent methyltransferase